MPTNTPGHTFLFNYIEKGGAHCTANLDGTSLTGGVGPYHFTRDSMWYISYPFEGRVVGPCEKLTYLGTDGQSWLTKVFCNYNSGLQLIEVKVESEDENGNGNNPSFQIVDWDGTKWGVQIDSLVGKNGDARIGFTLSLI